MLGRSLVPTLCMKTLRSLADAPSGVVIAVSGGADSVALVRALESVRDPHAPSPLVLAHLNHQLRGRDSDADEEFVAALHAQLTAAGGKNLTLCRASCDIAAQARAEGANLEALARRERYRWLAEVAREHGMKYIATGHTANDQAETVLHRLLRGTGLRGLRGIAASRQLEAGLTLIRPLLSATRAEIIGYLHELAQPYREDASNRDLRYTRNRIRHELLPHLAEHYNPGIVGILAGLAQQAEDIYRIEESAALALLSKAELPRAGELLIFDLRHLLTAPRHQVREMFRLVWLRENWPLGRMDRAAWERLARVVFDELTAVDLPGGLHAHRRERVVQIGRAGRCGAAAL
ncbi:MAG TPA: tRNA lysidine(34) synthetase TilS [Gemmataceae bacterium]|nr:tRNA lysidine(34) synthetase TilS [Gemmataceae bacterium]